MSTKTERKPMTFAVAPSAAAPAPIKRADTAERQQVGARVTKATYRQLRPAPPSQARPCKPWLNRRLTNFLPSPQPNMVTCYQYSFSEEGHEEETTQG